MSWCSKGSAERARYAIEVLSPSDRLFVHYRGDGPARA